MKLVYAALSVGQGGNAVAATMHKGEGNSGSGGSINNKSSEKGFTARAELFKCANEKRKTK